MGRDTKGRFMMRDFLVRKKVFFRVFFWGGELNVALSQPIGAMTKEGFPPLPYAANSNYLYSTTLCHKKPCFEWETGTLVCIHFKARK